MGKSRTPDSTPEVCDSTPVAPDSRPRVWKSSAGVPLRMLVGNIPLADSGTTFVALWRKGHQKCGILLDEG